MSNMRYCRFQNTDNDFEDCLEIIKTSSISELSQEEKQAYKSLKEKVEYFLEYTEDFEQEIDYSDISKELHNAIDNCSNVSICTDADTSEDNHYIDVYHTTNHYIESSVIPIAINDLDTMVLEIVTYLTDHDLKVIRIIKGE